MGSGSTPEMDGRVIPSIKGGEGMKGNDEAAARQRSRARKEQQMALNTDNKDRSTRGSAFFPLEVPEIRHLPCHLRFPLTSTLYTRTLHNKTTNSIVNNLSVRHNPRSGCHRESNKTTSAQRLNGRPSSMAVSVVKIKAR